MAIARLARLGRQAKRPCGLWVKMTAVAILGLCFVLFWSMFSSSANSVVTQRESFDEIAQPMPVDPKVSSSQTQSKEDTPKKHGLDEEDDKKVKIESDLKQKQEKKANVSDSTAIRVDKSRKRKEKEKLKDSKGKKEVKSEKDDAEKEKEEEQGEGEEEEVGDDKEEEEGVDSESEVNGEPDDNDDDLVQPMDEETLENIESEGKKKKIKGPIFTPKAHYSWKLCSTRSKHNYIPCIDIESGNSKVRSHRHSERSCPRNSPMCLVPLPHSGYGPKVTWPKSKSKVGLRV